MMDESGTCNGYGDVTHEQWSGADTIASDDYYYDADGHLLADKNLAYSDSNGYSLSSFYGLNAFTPYDSLGNLTGYHRGDIYTDTDGLVKYRNEDATAHRQYFHDQLGNLVGTAQYNSSYVLVGSVIQTTDEANTVFDAWSRVASWSSASNSQDYFAALYDGLGRRIAYAIQGKAGHLSWAALVMTRWWGENAVMWVK